MMRVTVGTSFAPRISRETAFAQSLCITRYHASIVATGRLVEVALLIDLGLDALLVLTILDQNTGWLVSGPFCG